MNNEIEIALKEWLTVENVSALTFTGFTGDAQPPDEQTVTVFVPTVERVVGPLYRATVNFIVATPPHDEATPAASLAAHRVTVAAIQALLEDHDVTSLKTTIENESSLYGRGGWLRDSGTAEIESGKWVTTLDFLLGISTEAAS